MPTLTKPFVFWPRIDPRPTSESTSRGLRGSWGLPTTYGFGRILKAGERRIASMTIDVSTPHDAPAGRRS